MLFFLKWSRVTCLTSRKRSDKCSWITTLNSNNMATLNRSVITVYLNCNTITSRQLTHKCNIAAPPRDYFCRGRAESIKYYDSISVFLPSLSGMQIAYFLLSTISSYVTCVPLSNFSKLSHKRNDFQKKKMLLNTKWVFLFSMQLLWKILSF